MRNSPQELPKLRQVATPLHEAYEQKVEPTLASFVQYSANAPLVGPYRG